MAQCEQLSVSIILTNGYGNFQRVESDFYLAGSVFLNDNLLTAEQLRSEMQHAIAEERLVELLKELNGFYTVIYLTENKCYLISDKVRTRPLFYALRENTLLVSDSADALNNNTELNVLSAEEYLSTGFVSGSATLIADVDQIQAAEVIFWNRLTKQQFNQFYDMFLPENKCGDSFADENWLSLLDKAMIDAIQRLVTYANGRQIVLPLSGGYDSRSIALYLKKIGYKNVFCFTFGRLGSPEVAISQQVAIKLGFPWYCVNYTAGMWRDLKHNDEFKRYLEYIHNFVSVPNIQVYPAIEYLTKNKLIALDAVLVPGHTGDFISGGHMPKIRSVKQSILSYLFTEVTQRHYGLNRMQLSSDLKNKLMLQMQAMLVKYQQTQCENPISLAEAWNCRERQAKFIANSNRYYDYFKLDWWMPLWDSGFVSFWVGVPYQLRKDKSLWIKFVDTQSKALDVSHISTGTNTLVSSFKMILHRYLDYFFDNNHLYGTVPFSRWLLAKTRLSSKPGTVFGFAAEKSLANSVDKIKNS